MMSMKSTFPSLRFWTFFLVIILLALGSLALSPVSPLQRGVFSVVHAAPTPPPELPVDEVSTDLIVFLGGVLLLIVLLPILWHMRLWRRNAHKGDDDCREQDGE